MKLKRGSDLNINLQITPPILPKHHHFLQQYKMPFLTYTTLFERSKRGIEKSMKNLSKQRSKQPVTNGEKNIDPSSVKTKRGHYITKFTNPNNALLYKGKSFKMTIHFQGVSSTPQKKCGVCRHSRTPGPTDQASKSSTPHPDNSISPCLEDFATDLGRGVSGFTTTWTRKAQNLFQEMVHC